MAGEYFKKQTDSHHAAEKSKVNKEYSQLTKELDVNINGQQITLCSSS